jgi:hypothetical protein
MQSESDLKNIAVLLAIFGILYFPMLVSLPLSIDAEVTIKSSTHLYWITQGRWAAYIVTILFPPHLTPYFTLSVFAIFSSVSYLLVLRGCNLPYNSRTLSAFPVFVGFPIWTYILEFSSNVVQVGIGLLCCCAAMRSLSLRSLARELSWKPTVAETALITFAIALYQSFVFVFPTLMLAWAIIVAPPVKTVTRVLARALLVMLCAIVAYYVIGKLFAVAFDASPGYVGQFLRPSLLLEDAGGVSLRNLQFLVRAYSGAQGVYGTTLHATGILTALFWVALIWRRSWMDTFLAVLLLVVPLTFMIVAGGENFPPRGLLGIPVALWAMAIIVMHARQKSIILMGTVVTLLVGFQSASAISTYQTVRLLRSEFDRSTAARVYTRISDVANAAGPFTVEFFGGLKAPETIYPTGLNSSAGGSFFSWDGGNPNRILAYMWLLGYQDLVPVAPADRQNLIKEFASMPTWPLAGSVRSLGHVVLVKLGDEPGRYCRPAEIGRLAAC